MVLFGDGMERAQCGFGCVADPSGVRTDDSFLSLTSMPLLGIVAVAVNAYLSIKPAVELRRTTLREQSQELMLIALTQNILSMAAIFSSFARDLLPMIIDDTLCEMR